MNREKDYLEDDILFEDFGELDELDFGDKEKKVKEQSSKEEVQNKIEYVDENGVGLVFGNQAGGMPGAFSAGADLVQVGTAAKTNRLDEVDQMIRALHAVIQKETYSPFPVVAAPYGLALGGGCEVCLAADRIVAHAEL